MRFKPCKRDLLVIIWMTSIFISFASFGQDAIYPYFEDGKIGYRDSLGQVRLDPRFDYIEEFSHGLNWTVVGIGKYEILSKALDRKELNFTGKFGLIDHTGHVIFEPVFNIIFTLDPEFAMVGVGTGHIHFENFPEGKEYEFKGDLGIMNIQGDTIVPVLYQTLKSLDAGKKPYWLAGRQNELILYSPERITRLDGDIESVDDFSEGLARIKSRAGNYGFMDTTGQVVIPPRFSRATRFEGQRAWVRKQDRYFFIDKKGEKIDTSYFRFDEVAPFSDGVALVRIFDEYGYIKPDSSFFIRPQFSEAGNFFNGITYVATEDSFGYIHKNSKRDIVLQYNLDPVMEYDISKNEPVELQHFEKIPCECRDSAKFNISFDSLGLSDFVVIHLEALRWAPYLYYQYPQMLDKICAGEGTLAGRHDFNFSFLTSGRQPWEDFKTRVFYVILKNEYLRSLAWKWLWPYYKRIFLSMPEMHRQVYREMLAYLSEYFEDYPIDLVKKFLEDHPNQFAYQHWDGSTSPFRKISAALERLIFIHGVMDPGDVQFWIRKIREEMQKL